MILLKPAEANNNNFFFVTVDMFSVKYIFKKDASHKTYA